MSKRTEVICLMHLSLLGWREGHEARACMVVSEAIMFAFLQAWQWSLS